MTGTVPDWYTLLKAARYLNCAPWELAEQPAYWLQWALHAEAAEAAARAQRAGTN